MSVYSSLGPLPARQPGPRGGAVRRAHQPQQQMLCAYAAVAQPAGVLRGALYRQARVGRQACSGAPRLPAARLRRHQPRDASMSRPRESSTRAPRPSVSAATPSSRCSVPT